MKAQLILFAVVAGLTSSARAQVINPPPSGGYTDGAFDPSSSTTKNLALATTGTWDSPSSGNNGVYDPDQWAVVFKYTSVRIRNNVNINFSNHPTTAPVVWLVEGNVTIESGGQVILDGVYGGRGFPTHQPPGPGGFRGGKANAGSGSPGSAGFGPGGGVFPRRGGSHSSAAYSGGVAYGNASIIPLIGGSGGAGEDGGAVDNGGSGAGAILIVANGTVTINGYILARGGTVPDCNRSGGGSGGAIRIVGNSVAGSATYLQAHGQCAGSFGQSSNGRIRIEANTITLSGASNPAFSQLFPLPASGAQFWSDATAPSVRVLTVDGLPVPADPTALFNPPGDVLVNATGPVVVVIQATNVPLTWNVNLRAGLRSGNFYSRDADFAGGDENSSTWTATLDPLPESDYVALQARAAAPTP